MVFDVDTFSCDPVQKPYAFCWYPLSIFAWINADISKKYNNFQRSQCFLLLCRLILAFLVQDTAGDV